MPKTSIYPRFAKERLLEALNDAPLVLLHGPRQCGKTTLAQDVGIKAGYTYFSFDEPGLAESAKADPGGFVADLPHKAILDEVQHVPEIFSALKLAVDRDRRPGRAILTGSANVLLLPKLADSLAGRMRIMRLFPLSQSELAGQRPDFLRRLFNADFKLKRHRRLGQELTARIAAGGFPDAVAMPPGRRRREWCLSYVEALLEKDLREQMMPGALAIMPKLLKLAAAQTAKLINISELAAPFQVSRPTIAEYTAMLERVFLLETLAPWHRNRLSRLIKTSKLHIADTGLAAALLGADAADLAQDRPLLGQLLETFVVQELRKQASWHESALAFHHYRDKDKVEVDLVLEQGLHAVAGIEVKAAASVGDQDLKGLRKLAAAAGKDFVAGVVLYDGDTTLKLDQNLFAVPLVSLWEP